MVRSFFRFSLATSFAAMLLAVSAAGWIKACLDRVEAERATLAAIARAGGSASYLRGEIPADRAGYPAAVDFEAHETDLFRPIRLLDVDSPTALPHDVHRRAASLADLQALTFRVRSPAAAGPASSSAVAEFGDPELSHADVTGDLPEGTRLAGEEFETTLAEIERTWRGVIASPPGRYSRRLLLDNEGRSFLTDVVRDGPRWSVVWSDLPAAPSFATLWDGDRLHGIDLRSGDLDFRIDESAPPHCREGRNADHWLDQNWLRREGPLSHMAMLARPMSIRRIDDRTIRLDLEPYEFDADERTTLHSTIGCSGVTRLRVDAHVALLRSDQDWAPVAERWTMRRLTGDHGGMTEQAAYVQRFAEFDGRVALAEGYYRTPVHFPAKDGVAEVSYVEWNRMRLNWDFTPVVESDQFDPDRYLRVPLPKGRESPIARWHYATFAIGVIGLVVAGGRKLLSRPARSVDGTTGQPQFRDALG